MQKSAQRNATVLLVLTLISFATQISTITHKNTNNIIQQGRKRLEESAFPFTKSCSTFSSFSKKESFHQLDSTLPVIISSIDQSIIN